jgi:hypothetical protein
VRRGCVSVHFGEKFASDADTSEAMLVHRLIADRVTLN